MLIDRPLNEQKQMLGERLFVLVQQIEPKFTAKITGMFLEFEIRHILTLITSPRILKDKVSLVLFHTRILSSISRSKKHEIFYERIDLNNDMESNPNAYLLTEHKMSLHNFDSLAR